MAERHDFIKVIRTIFFFLMMYWHFNSHRHRHRFIWYHLPTYTVGLCVIWTVSYKIMNIFALLIGPLSSVVIEILIKLQELPHNKMDLKYIQPNRRPFYVDHVGLDMLYTFWQPRRSSSHFRSLFHENSQENPHIFLTLSALRIHLIKHNVKLTADYW